MAFAARIPITKARNLDVFVESFPTIFLPPQSTSAPISSKSRFGIVVTLHICDNLRKLYFNFNILVRPSIMLTVGSYFLARQRPKNGHLLNI
ncbi:hypothetical protein Sjap_020210 [Stephania japonica]|uniref:Uncharacterized protein n=1 Tax=Stephania japonica TaxID=461633 RepID=A0AAP0F1N2_9MAGN